MPVTIKKIAEYTSGLVLVTGPTGSGKSTKMAAIIDYINDTIAKIIQHEYEMIDIEINNLFEVAKRNNIILNIISA